jgi:hypothetical protein
MNLVNDYIQRCDLEIKKAQTNIQVEDAKKQLWYEFKGILEQIEEKNWVKV